MIPRVLRIQKMIAGKAGNPAFSALQKAVDISMEPASESNGKVEVKLSHNLGSAAVLDYDMKAVATPVSDGFWTSLNK